MPVEQEMRPLARALRQHHRMPGGVVPARLEADVAELPHQPVRRLPASPGIGRVGRDALDPQEREEPLQRLRLLGVDPVEHSRERHATRSCCSTRRKSATSASVVDQLQTSRADKGSSSGPSRLWFCGQR